MESDCLEGHPLSILVKRPQKELGPCEPARPEREDVGQSSQRHKAVKPRMQGPSVKSKTRSSQAKDAELVSQVKDMKQSSPGCRRYKDRGKILSPHFGVSSEKEATHQPQKRKDTSVNKQVRTKRKLGKSSRSALSFSS